MPKDVLEIKAFESGNIYNADDKDIPDDAAVYSENIDPYGQSGSLMAIQADATAIKSDVDAKRMAMINNNGTHQLAYIDNSDGYLKQIADVYAGSPAITNLEESNLGSGTIPAMQTNNKEVHIGLGQTKDAKWVGNIPHGQFGGSAPSGLQSENAELISPSPFPLMHTIVNDASNTYVYGISQNGNYVYKFDVTKTRLIRRSSYYFTKTRAMCLASDGNLWVLDEVSSNIKIIKIDTEEMDASIISSVNSFTNDTLVTDCIDIDNHLWISCQKTILFDDTGSARKGFLYNTLKSGIVSGATISCTDRTPWLGEASNPTTEGNWVKASDNSAALFEFAIPKLPLSEPPSSEGYCGILMRVTFPSSGNDSVKFRKNGAYSNAGTWFYQLLKHDHTANDSSSKADGGSGGKVFVLSSTTTVVADLYQCKGHDRSNKLTITELGSAGTTSFHHITKVPFSTTNGGSLSKSVASASRSLANAVVDGTGDVYNIFSSSNLSRWATLSGSTVTAKLESEVDLSFSINTDVGTLSASDTHFYATSFIYDGYQESPLSPWEKESCLISGSTESIDVTISLYVTNLSKRVSHVNIYRSTSSGTTATPTGFFRLIKTVSLKYGWLNTDTSTSNPDWGNFYTKTILDTGASYASYESRTGISEALFNTILKYGLSAKVNNFLYITDCSHPDIDDATNYLFKSRPFNFDQFNWAKDFLLLPSKATAMETFNGRLYVFSENETYVVNPDGMYIEDTIKGIGCRNQNGVVASEIGMCFIDKNSIYLHNGQSINDIGAKIKKAHQIDDVRNDYSALDNLCEFNSTNYGGDIVVGYDGYRKSFCFFYQYKFDTVTTFQQTGCSYSGVSESVNHPVNANIVQGLSVSGPDIPANSYILDIVSDNNSRFELNSQPTGSQSNSTLTFTNTVTTYIPQCLVYTVPKNRWDVWNRPYTSNLLTLGVISGKNNELIVSDNINGLIKPFDPKNTTRLDNFIWYSKKFTMGESTSDKRIYKAEILSEDSTPTITVNTAENSDVYSALSTARTARHAQVKLAVTGDITATIDALRLVFRRLKRTKAMS